MRKFAAGIIKAFVKRLYPYIKEEKQKCEEVNHSGYKHLGDNVFFDTLIEHKGEKYIEIGDNVIFSHSSFLTAWDSYNGQHFEPSIKIGSNCFFGAFLHITSINLVEIGDGCLIGKWVTVTDNSHGKTDMDSLNEIPIKRDLFSKGPVIIGKNVWVGDKATILPGVTIGDGCVIGANTVVCKDVPPFSVVVGNPGRVINRTKK